MSGETEEETKRKKNWGPHGYGKAIVSVNCSVPRIPASISGGFAGDPDDYSLRKSEKNLLIPQIRRQIVKEEKCAQVIKGTMILCTLGGIQLR